MTEKQWKTYPQPTADIVKQISESINVSRIPATVLAQRNIITFEQAKAFFRPSLNDLHDPFLMKDMDKAVERLSKAIAEKEKILIYGDYDVDGTTSVALVYGFLRALYSAERLDFYVPDRYKEGYGISKKSIDWAVAEGFSLVIALDCGIKSVELVAYAREKGLEYIICDHHLPGNEIPNAVAVLDAKRKDCPYPYKELSGCGVGFKFMQAYCQKHQIDLQKLYDFLDLLVVSISADIVHMTGENRVLSFFGLERLNDAPRLGLNALKEVAGFAPEKKLNIRNVVFGLAPRINAAGRIEHAKKAVQLLLCEDPAEASHWAELINQDNSQRRDLDSNITQQALQMIVDQGWENHKSTVLFNPEWHKGVIGIVASRCIETYYRPTIILTQENGKVSGSARSVEGFDLYHALEHCADVLEQFGGHMHAAGMSLKPENVDKLRAKFEEIVSSQITQEQQIPTINIDAWVEISELTLKMHQIIMQLSPFGPLNMQPTFAAKNLITENPQILKEQHLKMRIKQPNHTAYIDAIGFGMAHFYPIVAAGKPFQMAFQTEINEFQGNTTLQLMIKDIKPM
ncbi:MAG: single-stranded-DNA-specific exonuclease RecJ [Cytophagales bacterium]|nr:MAG: single-stranded-DNA-specific exonuclease RecJ [Cytophagales bacterium]